MLKVWQTTLEGMKISLVEGRLAGGMSGSYKVILLRRLVAMSTDFDANYL